MTHSHSHSSAAQQEKSLVAATSVIAALGLTTMKFVVGLLTNSLGILAEAAHSALDLMAALITYFTVRVSDKPADKEHPFGHGKLENISALIQSLILIVTAGWIIYESFDRLIHPGTHIELSIWAFIVMGVSIVVDYSRSRMLKKAAEKHNSQALEADALHFSIDIWSSGVVILGLILVWASMSFNVPWLEKADAIAALIVAFIILFVSGELGLKAIHELIDAAPQNGIQEQIIAAVCRLEGITNAHALRIRSSGGRWFVDMHITVPGQMTVQDSHALTEEIEQVVEQLLPHSDVTVHVEPDGIHPV
ncbi:MAG: cation diffusion facilitator family transporter [Thiofilum sp.]|uniref:cation diffusion facilitator family transporter n=1 Tax=Thiofilum sp. TaxID=2212733 RepID=UPI0025ED7F0C|nr:cation diffusion facilitator family transporter [Thiofilum sp.]MBK8453600.1 cation transporter [Thiofilum sp.]